MPLQKHFKQYGRDGRAVITGAAGAAAGTKAGAHNEQGSRKHRNLFSCEVQPQLKKYVLFLFETVFFYFYNENLKHGSAQKKNMI